MIELRLHRTFTWVRAPRDAGEPATYGGPPRPWVLAHTDTLQFRADGTDWRDVPVVEGEKPEKPEHGRFGRARL